MDVVQAGCHVSCCEDGTDLFQLFKSKAAMVGVVGLGYVGLPLVTTLSQRGFPVVGFDVDPVKVNELCAGRSYIYHIPSNTLGEFLRPSLFPVRCGTFYATTDFSTIEKCDVILVCVPTPLTTNRQPDLSHIVDTAKTIAQHLRRGQLIVLESTSFPGTTDEVVRPILEATGLQPGKDFFLAFSPEREDPNNSDYRMTDIPKVVGGVTQNCGRVAKAFYQDLVKFVEPVSDARHAEATKLIENAFRSVNIALVNELKILFDRMKIDIWDVLKAASTKPFGFMPFYPGPGVGGHCIPVDPSYLTWKAQEFEITPHLIEVAGEINRAMPYFVLEKLTDALNQRHKSLSSARILILGVAYKENVDDTRESPGLRLIDLLRNKNADVHYNDPYVPTLRRSRHFDLNMQSVPLSKELLSNFDAVIIITNHDSYDYDLIVSSSKLVIDTRNATKKSMHINGNIVRA